VNRVKTSLDHKRIRRSIWLVLTVFVLLGYSLQTVAGSVYYSMEMQAYGTVSSPPVILEEGNCSGTSTIYTNNTSARVSVAAPVVTYDFVDNNVSDVDSSADKGTHGNFENQKAGPDSNYDTLTEANTASPATLTLRPDSAGYYQQWSTFGSGAAHWDRTSDELDTTGVQVTGSTSLNETENLADTTQMGTINSVTAYMRAKAFGSQTLTNSPSSTTGGWTNPTNAYADGGTYAYITSGTPSATQTYSNYGFNIPSEATITQVRARYDAWSVGTAGLTSSKNPTADTDGTYPWTNPTYAYTSDNNRATAVATIPTWRATGTAASGTGAITVGLPSGMSANDIVILVASTIAGGSITITSDGSVTPWTAVSGSPIDVTGGEKLYVWWGRWSSGTTGPTLTPGSDHIVGRTVAYYRCYAGGSPIDVSATGTETTSDTSFSFATGLTTTYNNEMIIIICSTGYDGDSTAQFGSWTGPNLGTKTERMDNCVSAGGGGGFGLCQASLVANGAVGTVGATLTQATPKSYITFALRSTVPNNTFDQIYGTFGITGSGTITKVEIGYEAYSSVAQQLDLYTSSNGGSSWNAIHTTANLGTSDPNTYTYIDVTSDTTWTWTLLNDANFKYKVVTHWLSGTPTWYVDALVVRITYTGVNDEQIRVDVSWDGGTSWSSKQTTDLGGTETTYWYDVTGVTSWTPEKLANGQLQVRVDAYTVGDTGEVRLDWIPVEVTYQTGFAVILWRTYSTDYESSAITISRTDFTDYSQVRAQNPNTGSSWTWTEVNALEIGSRATTLGSTETIQISEFWIVVDYTPYNYELDLEEQWTSADFDETNEYLCIKTGTLDSESLKVDVWNGTSWINVIASLTDSAWNNVSVTTWLTGATFTIRFLGGTETSDTTQDSWDIDATLLHVWTDLSQSYDYVLEVNNTVAVAWDIRLKAYDETNIYRLQNCTIYFHNGGGTSHQIYILNGAYNQQFGDWYALAAYSSDYIAITVSATSTGTSYVYVYLEILVLATSTYAQYVITFEIT